MIQLINKKENIFGDKIAFVENWDFSKANLNEENRILAITQVASICYQNPNALGSESLYNRLAAESKGLPSSSFEFVPVL
ncbi:FAD-dependent thymidylate synthase, partial [Aliarcobacter butzleri]|nr:FAD-dependent thymidylate synthase [Aliarcobacter butzleri]